MLVVIVWCCVTQVIEQGTSNGGVLLLGYEMFRLLATRKTKTRKRRANAGPELIDIDLEEKNSGLQLGMESCLIANGGGKDDSLITAHFQRFFRISFSGCL